MANIKSAKKRIGIIEKKTLRNRRVKEHLKEIIKDFESAVAEENKQEARDFLALAEKKLLQAGAKGTIHKNAASRKVSRLTQRFVKVFGQEALLIKANLPAIPTPEEKAARRAEREAAKAAALAKKKGRKTKAPKEDPVEEPAPAEAEETEDAVVAEEPAAVEEAPAVEVPVVEATESEEAPVAVEASADEPAEEAPAADVSAVNATESDETPVEEAEEAPVAAEAGPEEDSPSEEAADEEKSEEA